MVDARPGSGVVALSGGPPGSGVVAGGSFAVAVAESRAAVVVAEAAVAKCAAGAIAVYGGGIADADMLGGMSVAENCDVR